MSREALAFLTKAAKGIKGGIDPKALHEALPLIGWAVQDVVVTTPIDGEKMMTKEMREILQRHGVDRYNYFHGSAHEKKLMYLDEDKAKALFRDIKAFVTETANKKPPVAQVGEIILRNLHLDPAPVNYRGERDPRWIISFLDVWMGLPGWIVKNSQGSEVVFTPKLDRGRLDPIQEKGSARFWTFAYKSGLKEAARNFLEGMGTDVVQNILKPVDPRTLINTGTCPACFRNTKLVQGRMMRHGWRVGGRRQRGVTGMSWHSGPCFGVGYEPFEVSPQGTKDFLKQVVLPAIAQSKKNLAFLETRPVLRKESSRGSYVHGKYVREMEEIQPTHYDYDRFHESEMWKVNQLLKMQEDERDMLSARIAAWKPKALYTPPSARDPRSRRLGRLGYR